MIAVTRWEDSLGASRFEPSEHWLGGKELSGFMATCEH